MGSVFDATHLIIKMDFEKYYAKETKQVINELNSNTTKGLTNAEANKRTQKYGYNTLKEKKGISPIKIFFSQFQSIVVYILIAAVIISMVLGEFVDGIVILIILILNAVFGFIQEYKAEKSIEALKKLGSLNAKVIRNGKEILLDSKFLVPGDIIHLEEGDKVPADARIIEIVRLKIQEASLTGESTSINKTIEVMNPDSILAERKNMVYSGTVVTSGRGVAVITATGQSTELGKIAGMIQEAEEKQTPLQRKLDSLGKTLGIATIIICIIVFTSGFLRGGNLLEMFLAAVALAVAAIPEGLTAVVTISLAIGVQKMAKNNALIRKLSSVETLGCTTVICTDKTGTLTCNEMTVKKIYFNKRMIDVSGSGYAVEGDFTEDGKKINAKEIELLLQMGALNNNSSIEDNTVIGDPTEACMLVSAEKAGYKVDNLHKNFKRIDEIPFTSERKRMTTLHIVNNKPIMYTKGAPDVIIKHCKFILENNKVKKLTPADKKRLLGINEGFAEHALRVIAFAYKPVKKKDIEDDDEKDLIFVGMQAMIDPPRPGVKESILKCKQAGIKVVMITGDHQVTARAIGMDLGIGSRVMTGAEIDKAEDLYKIIEKTDLFARVNPEHKMKIVAALQKKGHVVAMTGDGVNDAPALKSADIGIAMGKSGTDVAKEASDMILTDDHFTSIVKAIENGRGIYDNIKKFVNFLLSSNVGEVFVLFVAMLIGFRSADGSIIIPLLAIQLLWINLLTDGLPALALGVDPFSKGIMDRKPRDPKEHIITKKMTINILIIATMICVSALYLFNHGLNLNTEVGRTMAFTSLVVLEFVAIYMIRSQYDVKIFSNIYLILALMLSLGLQFVVIYTPLSSIFKTTALGLSEWTYILVIAGIMLIIGKIANFILKKTTGEEY